jgi:hypothetical protein
MAAEDGELVQAFWQGETDGFVCRLVLVEHNGMSDGRSCHHYLAR